MLSDKRWIKSLPSGIESKHSRTLFVAKTTPVIPLIRGLDFCMRRFCDLTFALKLSQMSWLTFTLVSASQFWGHAIRFIFFLQLVISKLLTITETSLLIGSPSSSAFRSCLMLSRTALLGSSLEAFPVFSLAAFHVLSSKDSIFGFSRSFRVPLVGSSGPLISGSLTPLYQANCSKICPPW